MEKKAWYCCDNYEDINGTCVECIDGFQSDNGEACRPFTKGLYGRKCGEVCACENFEECNHKEGCRNFSDVVTAATQFHADWSTTRLFILSSFTPDSSKDQTQNRKEEDQLSNEFSDDDDDEDYSDDTENNNDETDKTLDDGYLNPYNMLKSSEESHRYSRTGVAGSRTYSDAVGSNTTDEVLQLAGDEISSEKGQEDMSKYISIHEPDVLTVDVHHPISMHESVPDTQRTIDITSDIAISLLRGVKYF
ncbi:unnamed protein product [Mytilus coruscus]|uniref:MEGF10_11 n=1 Tax=Mytilus coruscus TaxID=42192 RepID=A0A6J8DM73_MYTCO|nr:unnamed protein product [Mytilus coruscus]